MKTTAFAITALSLTVATATAEKIKEIDVVENTKTKDETVILIADIEVGDTFDEDMIGRIERDLVSSGLFKKVDVFTDPVDGGLRVTIVAKDKHSWVIAPTAYNQPTNKGGGFGFGENNLLGENKKLLLYGQVATGDSFFIGAYVDPSISGSRFQWQYDLYLRRERVFEYSPPYKLEYDSKKVRQSKINYLNSGIQAGINVFGTVSLNLRLRGAHVSFDKVGDEWLAKGAAPEDVTGDPTDTDVPPPGAKGWDISSEATLEFDGTANWYGITSGDKYKFAFEHALPWLGSDFNYWYATARYSHARKYFARHNLIIKGFFGYGKNLPFQQEYTSGGTDLRGYKNRQFRGNLRAAATVEYSVPLFTIKGFAFRALGFLDSTYTAFVKTDANSTTRHYLPDHEELGLAPFKNTVGLGTRLHVHQIVLPLLGLDFGYGLERGEIEMYFAIGLTGF